MKTPRQTPFADTAEHAGHDGPAPRDGARREKRREAYGRLIANADFAAFMFETFHALCAFEHDMRETTEFERGIRAAGSYIRRVLLVADGAPQFFADLDMQYYAGVRRGIVEAEKRSNQETGRP